MNSQTRSKENRKVQSERAILRGSKEMILKAGSKEADEAG